MFKDYLKEIDNTILKDIFCVAKSAINNVDVIATASMETGIKEERIYALLPIIIELAENQRPKMTSERDIEESRRKIEKLSKEFKLPSPEKPYLSVVKGNDDS